jgi:hypothetical protein
MDGYDEFNNKNYNFYNDIMKQFKFISKLKVIMTCRENYANNSDYQHFFGQN